MSSHGRRILGPTLRRACGISSLTTRAPQHPFHLPVCPSLFPFSTSQVIEADHRLPPQAPCSSVLRRNISFRPSIVSSPLQHGISSAAQSPRQPPSVSLLSSELHSQKASSRWPSTNFQHRCSGDLFGPHLFRWQACVQRSHIRGINSEPLKDKPAKDDCLSRTGARSETSPKMSEAYKAAPARVAGKNIIERLPNIGHMQRPGKEELLAAATGFWSRLKVRFKWFSIRSSRPFNVDEISAFFSWILLGHVLWIILGTTTFFSLAILAVNTVFAQGQSSIITNMADRAN